MMFDNSSIDYARMLLFVFSFLLYQKMAPNPLAPPATPGLLRDYKAVTSVLSKC